MAQWENKYPINNPETFERTTRTAKRRKASLVREHYLHSSYDRFNEIKAYKKVGKVRKLQALGKEIINRQIAREKQIYADLGVTGAEQLSKKFQEDEFMQQVLSNDFNNIYKLLADAFLNTKHKSSLNQTVTKSTANEVQKLVDAVTKNTLGDQYNTIMKKVFNKGGLGAKEAADLKHMLDNKKTKAAKSGQSIAQSIARQWKGDLLERCVGIFFAQLGTVKQVEVIGADKNIFGEKAKADTAVMTENYTVGLSAKNYAVQQNASGKWELTGNVLNVHGSSKGASIKSMIERIQYLKMPDYTSFLQSLGDGFQTDNFYYHIVNEAVNKATFASSDPAMDFMNTVKQLAAAWFGTQITLDTQKGDVGQTVDFLVVGNKALIPMSEVLQALQNKTAHLTGSISSNETINEEQLYIAKTQTSNAQQEEGIYTTAALELGREAAETIYSGIKISEIKLNFILSQFIK